MIMKCHTITRHQNVLLFRKVRSLLQKLPQTTINWVPMVGEGMTDPRETTGENMMENELC